MTPNGDRPIEEIRAGDWVLARPEDDPEAIPVPRLVEETFQTYSPLMHLHVGGQVIRTTGEHPFYVEGRGWTPAADLIEGDRLSTAEGRWIVVSGIEDAAGLTPVYNLRVADYHTYFIGEMSWSFHVWTHNIYVSRWGRDGLQPGDWVMLGPANAWNYIRSFKWQPGLGDRFASFGSGRTYDVPASAIHWPKGLGVDGWWKGLFGQRTYNP